MIYLYVRQVVADTVRWKEDFDIQLSARHAGGATRELPPPKTTPCLPPLALHAPPLHDIAYWGFPTDELGHLEDSKEK